MSTADLTTRERYALSHSAQILERLGHNAESATIVKVLEQAYDADERLT